MASESDFSAEPERVQPSPGKNDNILRVVRVKGGERYDCVIVSDCFWGFRVHWDSGRRRSLIHVAQKDHCIGCQRGLPMKELFYLHVTPANGRAFFMEFPPGAVKEFIEKFEGEGSYRGWRIIASRTRADNGLLHVERPAYAEKVKLKMPSRDPLESLRALWLHNEAS